MAIRGMGQVVTVTIGLIILCLVFGAMNPSFFSGKNMGNLLRQIAPTLIIGIGQSYILITGNIDLSIGSVVGMSCMISATMMTKGVNPWVAALITLASRAASRRLPTTTTTPTPSATLPPVSEISSITASCSGCTIPSGSPL